MNIAITILLVVAGIVALVLIIALFTKKEYSIEREVMILKTKQDVFNYVKLLKSQDFYSKWMMTDPEMKKDFKGTDGTVGFVYGWDGNKKAGKGKQEIKRIKEGERISTEIRFERPFKGISETYMTTENSGVNQTKVKWVFGSKLKYLSNIMLAFMNFDKILGKDIAASLSTLKTVLEK
jgi:hypothetical protein